MEHGVGAKSGATGLGRSGMAIRLDSHFIRAGLLGAGPWIAAAGSGGGMKVDG